MNEPNTPNIPDWIQAIGTAFQAFVSIFLLIGLYLTAKQIKESTKWNKLNATFVYIDIERFLKYQDAAAIALSSVNIDFYGMRGPLDDNQAESILNNREVYDRVIEYLDVLEEFTGLVNAQIVNEDLAYSRISSAIIISGKVFRPLIQKIRDKAEDNDFYVELVNLSQQWSERSEVEKTKYQNLKRALESSGGVKPIK